MLCVKIKTYHIYEVSQKVFFAMGFTKPSMSSDAVSRVRLERVPAHLILLARPPPPVAPQHTADCHALNVVDVLALAISVTRGIGPRFVIAIVHQMQRMSIAFGVPIPQRFCEGDIPNGGSLHHAQVVRVVVAARHEKAVVLLGIDDLSSESNAVTLLWPKSTDECMCRGAATAIEIPAGFP